MRSPIVAMLWENWRLTRFEVAARLVLSLVAAVALVFAGGGMGGDDEASALGASSSVAAIAATHSKGSFMT